MTLGLGDDKGWATWQGEAPARSASFNELPISCAATARSVLTSGRFSVSKKPRSCGRGAASAAWAGWAHWRYGGWARGSYGVYCTSCSILCRLWWLRPREFDARRAVALGELRGFGNACYLRLDESTGHFFVFEA